MDLSYTQNLEDYHLSLAFAGQPTGFYIDVGGGHPIADNVSMWFYERGCGSASSSSRRLRLQRFIHACARATSCSAV